jgi:membrane-bound ClpP family serine protease
MTYRTALTVVFVAFAASLVLTHLNVYPATGKMLLQAMNPDLSLILVLLGLIGIEGEFLRPGSIVPGITGTISVLVGVASLSRFPWNTPGLLLLVLAALLCVAEGWLRARGILACVAAGCLFAGLRMTVPAARMETALVGSILFMAITATLITLAFRARRNKIGPAATKA